MTKAIMIQGTMSNAGKSIVTAGLCRIFRENGLKAAPFKSQNMALNSYITADGLEMGRAQVVQAEAAGLAPDVRMNPILLKPVTNMGSQLIVGGRVRGNYTAAEYYAIKHTLVPEIMAAYNSLAAEFDVIVIEGAGSPAEINLKQDDFVNMGMARLAHAPVLLVGDIDRGGVFAQLYGTIALLEPEEQAMVKATLINKFRGDVSLLQNGLSMLEDLTQKPVAGVLPYLDVDIEDEDSLSRRFAARGGSGLDIAVIRLPKISNFTDFAPLEATPGVAVRYVGRREELGRPDLLILPGTKSTIADLLWLRECGLEAAILRLAKEGCPILGICGGYQMLGEVIRDPHAVEGGGSVAGLGLLPMETEFSPHKHRTRTEARVIQGEGIFAALHDSALSGYEIHMGRSVRKQDARPLLRLADGSEDGCVKGNVAGCYLHGFFDAAPGRIQLLQTLAAEKGVTLSDADFDWQTYKEGQYQKLAAALRQHLNMPLIYDILEAGV